MTIDTPCNTWVDLDLSTATILIQSDGTPSGQYVSGELVSFTNSEGPWAPQFWFDIILDPAAQYQVEVTFDSSWPDDDGSRFVVLWDIPLGDVQGAFVDGNFWGPLYENGHPLSADVGDVITATMGPGLGGWDDPDVGVGAGFPRFFIETNGSVAISAVRIQKVCGGTIGAPILSTAIPPGRGYPRDDSFGTPGRGYPPPSSYQSSGRRGGPYYI